MLRFLLAVGILGFSFFAGAVYPEDHAEFRAEYLVRNDADLVRANQDRRTVKFVRASGLVVTEILPDDRDGSRHQRFEVLLSNAERITVVYSLERSRQRVPVKVGSTVGLAGEYRWTRNGGLMHWLHEDDQNRRPDGYVEFQGLRYGKDN